MIKKKKSQKIKKKAQISKKIKNTLRNFTIVYQNIRGLKSKVDSVQEPVDDYQPNLLGLVETRMQGEEEITVPRYEAIYRNDIAANISEGQKSIICSEVAEHFTFAAQDQYTVCKT